MTCQRFDFVCKGAELPGKVVGGVADSAVGVLADAVGEGVAKALASLGTVWVKIGTPNVTTADGVTASPTVAFVQSQLWWYMAAAAILGVIIGGARMAWEQRAEPGRELLKGLLLLVVVSGCGLAMIGMTVEVTDEFARGVVGASLEGGSFGKNVTAMLGFTTVATGGTLGPLLVIVLGLIAILVSITQIMLMVVRAGMLVLLAGALPFAAAFTSTAAGRAWFWRFVAWLGAFMLYKPAAAIIYAAAFRLIGTDVFSDDGLLSVLVGLALMIVAVIALPALLRFLAPVTSAIASGGGGGGGAMFAAALPTGAIAVGNRMTMMPAPAGAGGSGGGMNGSRSSGPAGTGGPSGAGGTSSPAGGGTPGGRGSSGVSGHDRAPSAPPAGGSARPAGTGGAAGQTGAAPAGAGAAGASSGASTGPGAAGGATGAGAATAGAGPLGAGVAAGASAASTVKRGVQGASEGAAGSNDEGERPRGSE